MDFSPYKALLDRIVPLSYQQDAETLLNSLLPETDSRTHYRLLAEINRLKAPCLRVLDLRQLFPSNAARCCTRDSITCCRPGWSNALASCLSSTTAITPVAFTRPC
ncbi:hypothetical protein MBH78_10775 [Oceanimonas sp. NS1]|nr:hypothetical protein [Oceanimonas sp. NS1]